VKFVSFGQPIIVLIFYYPLLNLVHTILSFMLQLIPLTKYVTVLCGRLFHVLNTRYPTH